MNRWLRVILGGCFLLAGGLKVSDPVLFAQDISSFRLLPQELVPLAALGLPVLEILVAALLLSGWRARCGTFSALVLLGLYSLALVVAWTRGLPVECGCFGPPTTLGWALLRDLGLLAAAAWLYRAEMRRISLNCQFPFHF